MERFFVRTKTLLFFSTLILAFTSHHIKTCFNLYDSSPTSPLNGNYYIFCNSSPTSPHSCSLFLELPSFPKKADRIFFSRCVIEKERKSMQQFYDEHKKTLKSDLRALAQKSTEGCTRGFMRKCARGTDFNEMVFKLIGKRHSTISVCNKDPERSTHPHKEDMPNDNKLALWLWATRKCRNRSLKDFAALLCGNHANVAQALCDLGKEKGFLWLVQAREK